MWRFHSRRSTGATSLLISPEGAQLAAHPAAPPLRRVIRALGQALPRSAATPPSSTRGRRDGPVLPWWVGCLTRWSGGTSPRTSSPTSRRRPRKPGTRAELSQTSTLRYSRGSTCATRARTDTGSGSSRRRGFRAPDRALKTRATRASRRPRPVARSGCLRACVCGRPCMRGRRVLARCGWLRPRISPACSTAAASARQRVSRALVARPSPLACRPRQASRARSPRTCRRGTRPRSGCRRLFAQSRQPARV